MTIKEICDKFDITADTLRYYEKVGAIPAVGRTKGGIRNYDDEDVKWIKNAVCMRNAGLPIETLIEYVKLFQEGDGTIKQRRDLLVKARDEIQVQVDKIIETMELLDYKISRYDEAVRTGVLIWDEE